MEWNAASVRALRKALRQSQEGFAEHLGVSAKSVRNWERNRHLPLPFHQHGLDTALGRLSPAAAAAFQEHVAAAGWRERQPHPLHEDADVLTFDAGRVLTGATVALIPDQPPYPPSGLQRTLAVATRAGRRFAMDAAQLSQWPDHAIPMPYLLDDFTYGLLAAVANLDDALLMDDTPLSRARSVVSTYEQLRGSAVSRDVVGGLQLISQMWLGSNFCVRHIVRNSSSLSGAPVFWTAEQRGEESANWLVFTHKYQYLKRVRQRFGRTTRIFCIPEDTVEASSNHERVLLFLSMAMMESLQVSVEICADRSYGSMAGFVLDPGNRALVANWLRADGIWHVDSIRRQGPVRQFREAVGEGIARSAVRARDSRTRLQATAAYLGLDWGWVTQRAAAVASVGVGPFVRPRSRLLSVAGLERACAYAGRFAPQDSLATR